MKTKPRHIIFTLCLVATIAACMYKGFPRFWERCYNQVAYSFFGKTINPYVVKGRANELFLKPNIDDISGKTLLDHYGSIENAKAEAQKNVEATKRLIDTLHRHGSDFFLSHKTSCLSRISAQRHAKTNLRVFDGRLLHPTVQGKRYSPY